MKNENIAIKKKEKRKAKVDLNTYPSSKNGFYSRYTIPYTRLGELNKKFLEAVIKQKNADKKFLFKMYTCYLENLKNNVQDEEYSFEESKLDSVFTEGVEEEMDRESDENDESVLYNSKIVQDDIYEVDSKRSKFNCENINSFNSNYINSFVRNNDISHYQRSYLNEYYKDINDIYNYGTKYQNTDFYDFNYESQYRLRSSHSLGSRCKCCDNCDDIVPSARNYNSISNQALDYGGMIPCAAAQSSSSSKEQKNNQISKKPKVRHTCPDLEIYKFLVKHYGVYCPYTSIIDDEPVSYEEEKPFSWPFLEPPKKPRTVFDTGPTREEVGEYNRRIFDILTAHISCNEEDIDYEYNPMFVDKDFQSDELCVYKEYVELYVYNGIEYIFNSESILKILVSDGDKNIILKNGSGEIVKIWNKKNSKLVCKEDNLFTLCLEDYNIYCIIFRDHKHANKACEIIEK